MAPDIARGAGAGAALASRPGPRGRRGRLSRSGDFDRVFRQGRSYAGREFVLYLFPRGEDGGARLGLSVSRKVGGAVDRNRVKRLLREAFASERDRLVPGTDAVIIARPSARALAESDGLIGVRQALVALIDRASPGRATAPENDAAPAPDAASERAT